MAKNNLGYPLLRSFHYFNNQNTQYCNDIWALTNCMKDEPMFTLSDISLSSLTKLQAALSEHFYERNRYGRCAGNASSMSFFRTMDT